MPWYNFLMPYSPARPTKRNKKTEEDIQLKVCRYLKTRYKDLDFHSDYAAGLHLTMPQAVKRKALNSGRGWADLLIMKPSRGYSALFLELKKPGTSIYVSVGERKGALVANEQIAVEAAFLERMNELGYLARFAVGYSSAVQLIDWYLWAPKTDTSPF